MYKVGEYVVYKKDVCLVKEIKTNKLNNKEYYLLVPVSDNSLKIDVPVENELGNIRNLTTKKEIKDLIKKIPSIELINVNNKLMENEYKELLKEGSFESLIKIIKTTYLRNKERLDNKKKKGDKDDYYFNLAEKYLFTEFSVVLNMSFEEAKNYVINEVRKNTK